MLNSLWYFLSRDTLYKKKVTGVKSLDGRVACKLTTDNYGRGEWWLLLEPVES